MKVWLDDVRPAPEGWTVAKTAYQAVALLIGYEEKITEVSLDHDLGEGNVGNGNDVLLYIEEQVYLGKLPVLEYVCVHSANPSARIKMEMGCLNIGKMLARRGVRVC